MYNPAYLSQFCWVFLSGLWGVSKQVLRFIPIQNKPRFYDKFEAKDTKYNQNLDIRQHNQNLDIQSGQMVKL